MERIIIEKIAVTILLLLWFLIMPNKGYVNDDAPYHIIYMLSHANVWHLLGNLLVLWLIKNRLFLIEGMFIAFLMSFVPALGTVWNGFVLQDATMGFSGALFAMVGVKWGWSIYKTKDAAQRKKWYRDFLTMVLPFSLCGVLMPNINWCLHTYCLLSGFIYGRCRR